MSSVKDRKKGFPNI